MDNSTHLDVETKILPLDNPEELEPCLKHLYAKSQPIVFSPWERCAACNDEMGTTAIDIIRPAMVLLTDINGQRFAQTACNLCFDADDEMNVDLVRRLVTKIIPGQLVPLVQDGEGAGEVLQ